MIASRNVLHLRESFMSSIRTSNIMMMNKGYQGSLHLSARPGTTVAGSGRARYPRAKLPAARHSLVRFGQYASEEITSPPALVPRAHQVWIPMVALMNLTEPSQKRTFTPPG